MLVLAAALTPTAFAAEPQAYRVSAELDVQGGILRVRQDVRVRVAAAETFVRLWVYADRLSQAPSDMEERSWRWIYPGEVSLGRLRVSDLRVDGQRVAFRWRPVSRWDPDDRAQSGSDIYVPIASASERTVTISLRYRLRIPARFGRLGIAKGLASLAAPWYPLVVNRGVWMYRVPHHVRVRLSPRSRAKRVLLGGLLCQDEECVADQDCSYVPFVVGSELSPVSTLVDGVRLTWVSPPGMPVKPPPVKSRSDTLDLLALDKMSLARDVLRDVVATARLYGVPTPPSFQLVTVPSRTELAATASGWVIASDRLFEIFPLEAIREFHMRALRHALFDQLAEYAYASHEPAADRAWAVPLRAAMLADLDALRRQSPAQMPGQVVGLLAFHPAVDQLLYAPQIAFADSYFSSGDLDYRFRDDPRIARRAYSSGRRLLTYVQAFGAVRWKELVAPLLKTTPARQVLRRHLPRALAQLPGWLRAPRLSVNYRLGKIHSWQLKSGRWRHRVEIFRDGAQRVEPVEVEIEDERGARVRGYWTAPGNRGVVTIDTAHARRAVRLDPRKRLSQSARLAPGHPRADDATEQPWRPPLLNGFGLSLLLSEGDFTGFVDIALRKRYDLEHALALAVERTRANNGLFLRYIQGFGPKVHTNRRSWGVSAGLGFDHLRADFADAEQGGWRLSAAAALSLDTRRYFLDPRGGHSLRVGAAVGPVFRDDGSMAINGRSSVRATVTVPLGLVNALVLVAGGGLSFNPVLPSDRVRLGGPAFLRGYETGELLGTAAAYGVVEHRWTALPDLAWNVFHLVWLREIQLAAFTGVGVLVDSLDGRDAVFAAEVGAGIRFHYEYGGVQPGVMSLDLGVPLHREPPQLLDSREPPRRRSPVGFYVSFDQFF